MRWMLVLFFIPTWLLGQSFQATADTNKLKIGEQTRVLLQAEVGENVQIQWPSLRLEGGLELISSGTIDSAKGEDGWRISQEFIITSFDSGYVAFPPQLLLLNGDSLLSNPIPLVFKLPEIDPNQGYHDIKDVLDVPRNWWWIIGISLAALALIALLIWWWTKRKRGSVEVSNSIQLVQSPQEWALAELAAIEQRELWKTGAYKEHYTLATDVLRHYMERVFATDAMEQTTDELIDSIRQLHLSEAQKTPLIQQLRLSELVKFAKFSPKASDCTELLAVLRDFIEHTGPRKTEQGA